MAESPSSRNLLTAVTIVREEDQDTTGPTLPRRVTLRLERAGIAQAEGTRPDPWGRIAAERLQLIEAWTGGHLAVQWLESLRHLAPPVE